MNLPLDRLLSNRRWLRRSEPFPHVVARDVFRDDVYDRLESAFAGFLARKPADTPAAERFTRRIRGYDASTLSFRPGMAGEFSLFTSRPWHDMLAALAGVTATGDVEAGLHHHAAGSRRGTIHNDLNPGWFAEATDIAGINLSDPAACSYRHGTHAAGVRVHQTVRAVAMIYYVNNPVWKAGDGGETALFASASGPVGAPAAVVPPVNNSLVAFECTPYSYHAFLSNRAGPRNSMILWLHRPRAEAVKRWGAWRIVSWPRKRPR